MILVEAYLDFLLLEKNYSKNTVLAYKKDLLEFYTFLNLQYNQDDFIDVNYSQIRSWIVHLSEKNCTNKTINRKMSALKSFYNFLLKIEKIEVSPLKKFKSLKTTKKVQVPFSKDEISKVLESFQETDFKGLRDKLIIELFYSTGLRRIELINIKIDDLNLKEGTLRVIGKRNKERISPILKSVRKTILLYLAERNKLTTTNNYLFLTDKGVKIYEALVYRVINSYFSNVSSKVKKSPHILRHSFATHLLNEGANLNSVKELLGHSSLSSTQIYINNSLETLKKVYNHAHPRSNKTDAI